MWGRCGSFEFDKQLNKRGQGDVAVDIIVFDDGTKSYLRVDEWCYKITLYWSRVNRLGDVAKIVPLDIFTLHSPLVDYVGISNSYWIWTTHDSRYNQYVEIVLDDITDKEIKFKFLTSLQSVDKYDVLTQKDMIIDRESGRLTIVDDTKEYDGYICHDTRHLIYADGLPVDSITKQLVFGVI